MKYFYNGIAAGILIVISCSTFLSSNNYIGALLFSLGLYTICIKSYSLYTGRIGFILKEHSKSDILNLLLGLLGNIIATIIFGLLISYSIPNLEIIAKETCITKLENQSAIQTFVRSLFCGILMYVAVSSYKEEKSILNIFLCVPAFILAGFEHSIANVAYFSIANIFNFEALIFILMSLLGNTFGALILPIFKSYRK